ncbi:MAG TPA: hypothetical protein VK454_08895 [Myxococcaceae bacterium]|nr:hypothetical protein [Myxococcaceae bacterium]
MRDLVQRLSVRDGVWCAPLWLRTALVVAALGMFAVRFADRDLLPFILDEARFQEVASIHARDRTWPSISPLVGNLGIAYGPGPVWFYTAVHRLVGPLPERSILAVTVFLSLAQLALAAALARMLRGGAVLFATLAALLAASPFLFFWSRLAWEVFAGYTALAVALLTGDRQLSLGKGALLGALLGLDLTSHPMTVPLVLAVLLVLGREALLRPAGRRGLLALLAVAALVNVPYLLALQHQARPLAVPETARRLTGTLGLLAPELLEPARVLTTAGVEYFFDEAWGDFRAWLGGARSLLDLGPGVAVVLLFLAAAGLVWAALRGGTGARRVARIGLLLWAGHAVLLAWLALPVHPHYQMATFWLVPAGIGVAAMALLPSHPRLSRTLVAAMWVVALAQVAFDQAWMGWIRARGGTAGIHYSVPLAAQRDVLRAACATDRPGIAFANRTRLFPPSLLAVAATEPACAGKRVGVCPGRCPSLSPETWDVLPLRYAAPPGGRLEAVRRE